MHAGDEGADAAMPGAARPDILALEAFDEVNRVSQDSPEGLTPAQIRAVCDAHCLVCQQTIGGSEQARILACRLQGCELRGVDAWMAEVAWLSALEQSPLWGSAPVPAQAVAGFNRHIHQAACATFAIGLAPDGTLERSYAATTLRGLIHAALILVIAYNAGDRGVLNVNEKSVSALLGRVRTEHSAARRMRSEERQKADDARVAALYDQGINAAHIAREMGWSNDRARVNKALQRMKRKQKGRKHTLL